MRVVPDKVTLPPPLCVKAPVIDVLAPGANVSVPELAIATGPSAVVIMLPFTEMAAPDRLIPVMVFVFNAPKELVPPAADCVMDAAVMLDAVTLNALVIVNAPTLVVFPTAPLSNKLPLAPKLKLKV